MALERNARPQAPSNIIEVVKTLPERGVNTWEHLHAAEDANALLDWIRSVPMGKGY
ncbi:MAG TPA: hypothetical protein VML57_21195 [Burkholderiales bacterium]|nr:hypothetical protein [Burkholderiales bacterium]